jgi:ubiquinone/menaquinone biosynthesis C-methylase UbiE
MHDSALSTSSIHAYLQMIGNTYDIEALAKQRMDTATIIRYYNQTDAAYGFFHSRQGSIHLALNYDGKFDERGFYEQARIVEHQIARLRNSGCTVRDVLELGCGKGFNTAYLSERYPELCFTALDRTPGHLPVARRKAGSLPNTRFLLGDYHDLPFPDQSFDCVFVFEAICYARDMQQVLTETLRVLRPGGTLVVIDFFRARALTTLTNEEHLAAVLTEKSFAVDDALTWNAMLDLTKNIGFQLTEALDLSEAILPNIERFENMAHWYFRYPAVAKLIQKIMPRYLLLSLIAGLLLPSVVRGGIEGYYALVADRPC